MLAKAQNGNLDHIVSRLIEEVEFVPGKDSLQNKPLHNGLMSAQYLHL